MQLSFYPEPEDYEKLKALSAITGVPQQVYLRQGLQFVLKQEQGGPRGGASFLKAKGTRRQVWLEFLEHLAQRDRLVGGNEAADRSLGGQGVARRSVGQGRPAHAALTAQPP